MIHTTNYLTTSTRTDSPSKREGPAPGDDHGDLVVVELCYLPEKTAGMD
jgi:hypothetical protein